ncbi:hypothetical protein BC833DRAFT_594720 [Globomyces pollinis-pini]|nr:hypothetical protein BC833DRAFT_594720 [Globomyces pollinis-pini]
MSKFTPLEYASFIAHSLSLIFLCVALSIDLLQNRNVALKARPAQLLFLALLSLIPFHITGIANGYISAISMEQQDSILDWKKKILIPIIIYKVSAVVGSSFLLGTFSYTWTSVNVLLPNRKIARVVTTYSNLIVPVIFFFISMFFLALVGLAITLIQQPLRFYFMALLVTAIFQSLIALLLIPIIYDVTTALCSFIKLTVSKKGSLINNATFTLFRFIIVAIILFSFMLLSGYLNYKESDISYIILPSPSPNRYDQRNTTPFTQISHVLFGFGGSFASLLILGKFIDLKSKEAAVTALKTNIK